MLTQREKLSKIYSVDLDVEFYAVVLPTDLDKNSFSRSHLTCVTESWEWCYIELRPRVCKSIDIS